MTIDHTLTEIIDILTRAMGEMESKVLTGRDFAELSMRQLHYLDLVNRLGHPTPSELASELGVSRPTVAVAVGKLAATGYVTKAASHEDRRVAHVHLTAKGRRIVKLHDEVHQATARLFADALSRTELDTLVRMLNKVIARMGAMSA